MRRKFSTNRSTRLAEIHPRQSLRLKGCDHAESHTLKHPEHRRVQGGSQTASTKIRAPAAIYGSSAGNKKPLPYQATVLEPKKVALHQYSK
jgi:hypothetical protein